MAQALVSIIIVVYSAVLIGVAITILKGVASNTFFTANRQSLWYAAAVGMTGSFFLVFRKTRSEERRGLAAFLRSNENQTSFFQHAFHFQSSY